jgi:hypothetical protein
MQQYSEFVNGRRDLPQRVVGMWELLLPSIASGEVASSIVVSVERIEELVS